MKFVLLSLMLVLLVFEVFKEKYYQWQRWQNRQAQRPRQSSGRTSQSYRTDPRNRALQNDLLVLLRNDVPAAKRLLLQQRQCTPGKSDNWYLEKVIYDLERDRH